MTIETTEMTNEQLVEKIANESRSHHDKALAAFILWRVWRHALSGYDFDAMRLIATLRDSFMDEVDPKVNIAIINCYEWTNKQGRFDDPEFE